MITDISSLLFDAGMLLVVGMLVVFLFLSLLIGAIHVVSFLCKHAIEEFPASTHDAGVKNESEGGGPSSATVAAISAAIHQYRQSK